MSHSGWLRLVICLIFCLFLLQPIQTLVALGATSLQRCHPCQAEQAHLADFLATEGIFKAIQKALKGMTKAKILEQGEIMNACLGPKCVEKARQQHSGSGLTLPAITNNNVEAIKDKAKLFADAVATIQQDDEDCDREHWEHLAMRCGGILIASKAASEPIAAARLHWLDPCLTRGQ
jgi:hypothetical protein